MSRRRVVVAVTGLAFVLVAALVIGRLFGTERVPVASTGAPAPFNERSPIVLEPGSEVCAYNMLLDERTAVGEVVVDSGRSRSPDLVFRAEAQGYDSPRVRVEGGVVGGQVLRVPFDPPQRPQPAKFCARNVGDRSITFIGTDELRTRTALGTTIDGRDIPTDLVLTFYEDREVTGFGFLGRAVEYAAAFRGFLGAEWLVWLLLLAVVAGVPAALLFALFRALGPEPRR